MFNGNTLVLKGGKKKEFTYDEREYDVLMDLYFKQKNIMYSHLLNSYDKFLDDEVTDLLSGGNNNIFFEKVTKDKIYRYKFMYEDIAIKPPTIDNDNELMYPSDARTRSLTYSVKLVATITQIQEIVDIATNKTTSKVIGSPEKDYPIATIPMMVNSKYCTLNLEPHQKVDEMEGKYDPGGYFVINGSEKVLMSLERLIDNKPVVFKKKDSSSITYSVQVNSRSIVNGSLAISSIQMKKDKIMQIRIPILNEVNVFILIRALGIESDKDIINYTVYDMEDIDMINLIKISLEHCVDDNGKKILTKEAAVDYLINKMRVLKKYKYTETDPEIKKQEKKTHLKTLLNKSFLPHIEADLIHKAYYVGYMINKLMQCKLGRTMPDDRDSFTNKRVDLPGTIMYDLFKQGYKKMLNECSKFFKKRNSDDTNPQNIINQIKPNIIEQGLKTSLSTGSWDKKKGVAQMLQRLTFLQTVSTLRKVNSTTVDASTNKLTSPRHYHPTQVGYLCPIETSEGHKVGLVKNLSMMGNITIAMPDQIKVIKDYMDGKLIDIEDIPPEDIKFYTKVFLNGEWLGITKKARELYHYFKELKFTNKIEMTTSIAHEIKSDIDSKELHIHCDGGRCFRPLLRVVDNEILLKKHHLDMISIDDNASATKITNWSNFMIKFPGVIEYVDQHEQFNSMLAVIPPVVTEMHKKMTKSIDLVKNVKPDSINVNMYDDMMYVKYTHCDIHPSMALGIVANNMVFPNCNQGPRNIFQYSQMKQAMGIYMTSYRNRLDISYILYHPQRPIVKPRMMKYINTDKMPTGENAIVAIMCYSGQNQEDSVILNQSAIDRGLYRSSNLTKLSTTIQKNQSTSQDDVFLKPDQSLVTGMKQGSYDKLNEFGYVPEETPIAKGDIIIGKVSPIQPVGNSTKIYKDNSEVYKYTVPGVVDKVWTKIHNYEGYEMRKIRIRSERTPKIGDKMCSRSGQKGTVGITFTQADMPFTASGITPDIIMNPNAIPSRMTVGQLIECLVGKVSAIRGHETDGTPFQNWDFDSVKDILESLGYERNGYEYLYNGMTGKKIKSMIFIGPTYYQRLKHMVNDKMHSRPTGPRTVLTRQAPEGRARDGGLRFGEMERDCMISHGASMFLKERMLDTADAYGTHVCGSCGLFAQRMIRKDNKPYATTQDLYFCPSCRNKTNIFKVRIPYAFKLLIQELMAMNIAPRIRANQNHFNA